MTRLLQPCEGATVAIHNDTMRTPESNFQGYLERFNYLDLGSIPTSERLDFTIPPKVHFEWETDCEKSVLTLKAEGFEERTYGVFGCSTDLDNFYANAVYEWSVNGSEPRSFRTEDVFPRWLHIDGISNVRDIGNMPTIDGKRIRQGLYIRGGEMDLHMVITKEGRRALREEINIITDLDLRGEAKERGLKHSTIDKVLELIPCGAYDDFIKDKPTCKRIFEVLARKEAYPVYCHCWGGADRTGTVSFLLEAILGVEDELLMRDYELTSLSIWGSRNRGSELFREFLAGLDEYGTEGMTYREKSLAFLRSCGVDDAMMESIRAILLY